METRLLGTKGGAVQRNRHGTYEFESEIYTDQGGWMTNTQPIRPVDGQSHNQFHYYVDCIVNNRPHIATGQEGLIVMELLDAIYESAQRGRPVEVTPR